MSFFNFIKDFFSDLLNESKDLDIPGVYSVFVFFIFILLIVSFLTMSIFFFDFLVVFVMKFILNFFK